MIALCNGVRGLKYPHGAGAVDPRPIALCNGVRGLKYEFSEDLIDAARSDRTL